MVTIFGLDFAGLLVGTIFTEKIFGIQGIGLAYATSNRGACHLRGYTVASEVAGIPVKTDPLTAEGKPELVKAFQDATAAYDSSGLCVFTTFAWTLADLAPQLAAACGARTGPAVHRA